MDTDKTPSSLAAQFFNNVAKEELANFLGMKAIFQSHELDTKELEETFIAYMKQAHTLKEVVRKQLDQTESVDDLLGQLHIKVKGNE